MCGEDLAALHQMGKSKRGGDTDTPGVELNLRGCSYAGLLRASLVRSFINDNERDGQIIRSQSLSLSLPVSPSHLIAISVSLSLCHNLFFSPSFLPPSFSYPSLPFPSQFSLLQHILSVLHFFSDLRHMIRRH